MIHLGIDPGAKGAMGKVGPGSMVSVHDLSCYRAEVLRMISDIKRLDEAGQYLGFPGRNVFAVLELPGYGPPMGKRQAVLLRESYERCAMALVAAGIPFEEVSPQTWKKEIFKGREIKKGKEGKAQARARAVELFPSLADQLSRVKDDGRAEALLLAEYARRLRAQ